MICYYGCEIFVGDPFIIGKREFQLKMFEEIEVQ